jgi:hypothetical protein
MALIKCYKVKLKDLSSISEKAYKATAYDGSSCILPKSQVIRPIDNDAWYISTWIMDQKEIQHSKKNIFMVDTSTMQARPFVVIEHHVPKQIENLNSEPNDELIR